MKHKPFNKNEKHINTILLCIGLLLLLANTYIELGVLNAEDKTLSNVSKWTYSILSNVTKSIGIAIIIGFITNIIIGFQANHHAISKKEYNKILNDIFTSDGKNDDYKIGKAMTLYDTKMNYRYDATYTVSAYIENDKVVTRTLYSFTEEKTSGKHDKINSFSDDNNIKTEFIRITNPDNTNQTVLYTEDQVNKSKSKAFGDDLKYQYSVSVPNSLKKHNKLHIEKCFIQYGHDHWQTYALLFMRPCKGVKFVLELKDNLIVKDIIIFGEDSHYVKTQTESSLVLNSSSWISNYNGFSMIIAKKEESSNNL